MVAPPVGSLATPGVESWAAIDAVLDRALELEPSRRLGFVAETCSGDHALRREVERLLQAGDASERFLAEPAAAYASRLIACVADHEALVAGEWLGPYLLEGELGRGGMATVYLAHDPRHGRRVALKVMRPELSGALAGGRFAREIAIAARLRHPHILPLYDSGTLEGPDGHPGLAPPGSLPAPPTLFYTMPYVAGRSLRDRLRAEGRLPVAEAVALVRQVAAALDYAHRHGVIHRDIKPENILLAEGGARVADFGIARALEVAGGERLTETGLALGTPAYMSPEQAAGAGRLDGRSDIYGLGCVLYELLAGEPPFTGASAPAVLARHARDPVPSLRTVRPTIGPELDRAVQRALAKVPADRFPTAAALEAALAAPQIARTYLPGSQDTLRPRPRRGRLALGVGLAAAAGLAVALGLGVPARVRRDAAVAGDPTVIAIAPFRVAQADTTLGYLREGLVDLLATRLSGTLALHPVDSRTLLSAWRLTGGGAAITERQAVRVARRLGARRVVMGNIVRRGSRVTLSATLLSMAGGNPGAPISIEGSRDSVVALIETLAVRLMARAAGEPEERVPAFEATSMTAFRNYLDGWTLVRRNAQEGAVKKFETALAADSTFALANLGAIRAMLELGGVDQNDPHMRRAWRLRDRLPPKDRALLEVILGPRYPGASTPAEEREATERLVRVDPENADAWNAWGILNCSHRHSDTAVASRCRAVARRVGALDTSNAMTLYNATAWAAELGDTASARRMLRLYLRQDSLSPQSAMLRWITAAKLGDTVAARRAALSDSIVSTHADWQLGAVWQMLNWYVNEGRGLSDAELVIRRSRALAVTDAQRSMLDEIPVRIAVMRGRADGLPTSDFDRVTNALFADADPVAAIPAAATLERQVGTPIKDDCCLVRFMAAQSALAAGRTAIARRALTDMERYAKAHPEESKELPVYPAIVETQLAVQEGRPTAGALLRRLDSMLVDQHHDWQFQPLYGNLISARLHEARREYKEALAAIRRHDDAFFWPIVVTYHREEGRIAAEAGDTAGAIRAYERYLRIRDDAEPRLRPEVERVRAELAALAPPP